jgi:hypothetical protein
VLRGSSAGSNPSITVSPSAMAPNNRARWEIDLSPGTRTVPCRLPPPVRVSTPWEAPGKDLAGVDTLVLAIWGILWRRGGWEVVAGDVVPGRTACEIGKTNWPSATICADLICSKIESSASLAQAISDCLFLHRAGMNRN